jgi:hypothetical protein
MTNMVQHTSTGNGIFGASKHYNHDHRANFHTNSHNSDICYQLDDENDLGNVRHGDIFCDNRVLMNS